jgi:hypothetical protein
MLKTESKPLRVGRVHDLPISRSLAGRLIRTGVIKSYAPTMPGKKRGVRFVDLDSFEEWIKGCPASQQELPNFTAWVRGEPPQKVLP